MSSESLDEVVRELSAKIGRESAARIVQQSEDAKKYEQDPAYALSVAAEALAFHEKREEARRAARIARKRANAEAAGVPLRILTIMQDLNETEAVKVVREFMDGPKTLLVLAGGVGTGKSVAAAWACGGFQTYGTWGDRAKARFLKAMDLLRIGIYGDEAEAFAGDCKHKDLIVIDDLGTEPRDEKGYAAANFEAAMDYRYDGELKTILTTNLDFETFKRRYCDGGGARFLDRLREVGIFHGLAGGSMRGKS